MSCLVRFHDVSLSPCQLFSKIQRWPPFATLKQIKLRSFLEIIAIAAGFSFFVSRSSFDVFCSPCTLLSGSLHYALLEIRPSILSQVEVLCFDLVIFYCFLKSEDELPSGLAGMSDNENYASSNVYNTYYDYLRLGFLESNAVSCCTNFE